MAALEAKIGLPPCHVALASTEERWSVIERRLGTLETATKLGDLTLEDSDEPQESEDPEYGRGWEPTEVTATQRRLADELQARGVADFAFRRVASSYYSWPLEGRRQALAAPSIHHLCKSMVMINTRIHSSGADGSDPLNPKYIMVVVQYSARLNAEKLKAWAWGLKAGSIAKKYYNLRLAPEEDSARLTGFVHNAVTPVGSAVQIPIIFSHKIAALPEDAFFWLGGGEVDLKMGMRARDFIAAYGAHVVDCTYDDDGAVPTQVSD
ncbi:hypothetical protein QBZ16_000738 [Prototheca wickerhamii]|uniref:YbaK/aminoacyl-tRNA synthetase-associated domain-containing protein n=1 Tax=Prototheca wickerhamii TaxID=3111 RepID=A0AAD9ILQ2_PROWI|nr:hypothetical protein QBZ16_000738 [Prototheca wickerhamii]